MVNSVNSNSSAMMVLRSLHSGLSGVTSPQRQLSTGFKVQDAFDDGAAFAVAQSIRPSSFSLANTNQGLATAKGAVETASASVSKVSENLQTIRTVATQLSDSNLDSTKRTELQNQFKNLVTNIGVTIDGATSNGFNALGADQQKVATNMSGNTLEIGGSDLKAKLALPTELDSAAAAQAFIDPNKGGLNAAEQLVSNVNNDLATTSRRISGQVSFNSALQDALGTGLGAIIDADLAKESASLQALQVKQQLGAQSLSIANQAPQVLMSLFR